MKKSLIILLLVLVFLLGYLAGKYTDFFSYKAAGDSDYFSSNLYADNVSSTSPSYYNFTYNEISFSDKFRCDNSSGYVSSSYSYNDSTNLLFKDMYGNYYLKSTLTKPTLYPNNDARLKYTGPLSATIRQTPGRFDWYSAFFYGDDTLSSALIKYDYQFKAVVKTDGIYAVSDYVNKKYAKLKTVYSSKKLDAKISSYKEANVSTPIVESVFGSGNLAYKICDKK
ncbi:hypothetical protein HY844_00290 [Candidatus Berkelbacteria bacterium]|nr:hypothetical protein [Candidatus Berkelbacteria bacterium]